MINVRAFATEVEDLADLSRLPSVDALRPSSCPCCGAAAYPASGNLGVVGHGTYQRQVRGLAPGQWVVIFIRRYLCLTCKRTISVLPDLLLPWRWYSANSILMVLVQALLLGVAVASLRDAIGPGGRAPHWLTPARWARQLGDRLWSWRAAEVGHCAKLERPELLARILALGDAHARSPDVELERAACRLIAGTSHSRREVHRTTRAGLGDSSPTSPRRAR